MSAIVSDVHTCWGMPGQFVLVLVLVFVLKGKAVLGGQVSKREYLVTKKFLDPDLLIKSIIRMFHVSLFGP